MNFFVRGLLIIRELIQIVGIAIADFFMNLGFFIAETIMIIVTIVFWLVVLACLLGAGG